MQYLIIIKSNIVGSDAMNKSSMIKECQTYIEKPSNQKIISTDIIIFLNIKKIFQTDVSWIQCNFWIIVHNPNFIVKLIFFTSDSFSAFKIF